MPLSTSFEASESTCRPPKSFARSAARSPRGPSRHRQRPSSRLSWRRSGPRRRRCAASSRCPRIPRRSDAASARWWPPPSSSSIRAPSRGRHGCSPWPTRSSPKTGSIPCWQRTRAAGRRRAWTSTGSGHSGRIPGITRPSRGFSRSSRPSRRRASLASCREKRSASAGAFCSRFSRFTARRPARRRSAFSTSHARASPRRTGTSSAICSTCSGVSRAPPRNRPARSSRS